MTTLRYLLVITFYEFLFFATTVKTGSKPKETSGSYITVLHRIVACENPVVPYTNNSKGLLDIGVKNNIVKGNFTITGKNDNLQATMQDMYYIDGKWQTTFYAKNLSCRSQWIGILLKFLGVQYDKKTCAIPKGSYIVILNRVVPCKTPLVPYMKEPSGFLDVKVKNNIIIGNLTFVGKSSNIQTTLQDMYYIDDRWQTTFIAKNVTCHSKVIALMMELIGLRFNKKTCTIAKGTFLFEIDWNKLDHTWMPLRQSGRLVRRLEVRCKAGTIICCEFQSEVKPAT